MGDTQCFKKGDVVYYYYENKDGTPWRKDTKGMLIADRILREVTPDRPYNEKWRAELASSSPLALKVDPTDARRRAAEILDSRTRPRAPVVLERLLEEIKRANGT